jgi:hypothetical protein
MVRKFVSTDLVIFGAALIAFLFSAQSAAQEPDAPLPAAPAPMTYAPQPMATAPSEPGFQHGFLAMPYLGLQIPVGNSGDGFNPGFRMGTLLGGHINPMLSLNGEITIDVMNRKNVPSGTDVTEVMVDLLFSPLLHFGTEQIHGFFGPKIGAFGMAGTTKTSGTTTDGSANGWAYGVNLGAAFPIGNMAAGGLVSYVGRHATKVCNKLSGQSERCNDSPSGDDFKVFSVAGVLWF